MRNSGHLQLSQDKRTPPAHAHHKPTRLLSPQPRVGPRAAGTGRAGGRRCAAGDGRRRGPCVGGPRGLRAEAGSSRAVVAVAAAGWAQQSALPRCCERRFHAGAAGSGTVPPRWVRGGGVQRRGTPRAPKGASAEGRGLSAGGSEAGGSGGCAPFCLTRTAGSGLYAQRGGLPLTVVTDLFCTF